MCEETDREGRGLENKWIYVRLLFVVLGGQRWPAARAQQRLLSFQRCVLLRIEMTELIVALRVNGNEST